MRQDELAELLDVGLRSVQSYEAGDVIPYRRMKDLERVLDKPVEWFLHGDTSSTDGSSEELAEIKEMVAEVLAILKSTSP